MKPLYRVKAVITSYYQPDYVPALVYVLQQNDYSVLGYLRAYWSAQDFTAYDRQRPAFTTRNRALVFYLSLGALFQVLVGVTVLIFGGLDNIAGSLPLGLALVLSYPLVWAHMLALTYFAFKIVWSLVNPKRTGRALVCAVLEDQVVRLRRHHRMTVIAVAGSIGKTSTKLAIAHTLEPTRRVIYQTGNYNDRVTVPLVLFGRRLPGLLNVPAWLRIFAANERTIRSKKYYDLAVVELGTDHPGDIARFAYLQPDITVVTAVTPEHMEYFGSLDAVAAEELAVCGYSGQVLVNADDTPAEYLHGKDVLRYGTAQKYNFSVVDDVKPKGLGGSDVTLRLQGGVKLPARAEIMGEQGVKILLAAAAAAQLAGLSAEEITTGLQEVKPFAGRMQILPGIKGSTIIDDSYNASPQPVEAALDVLYAAEAPQRIAVLGNMNELGDYSQEAHEEVGRYCDPARLDLVITIGTDAKRYLAPAAAARGCAVVTADSPYEAGDVLKRHLVADAVVLVEGSQNGVFAEECIKSILANPSDAAKLVRQSSYWMKIKNKQFPSR